MMKRMVFTTTVALCFASLAFAEKPAPQMTIGNGVDNAITVDGLVRIEGSPTFSEVRVDGGEIMSRRANSTSLVFPEVKIAEPGWLVLHPVMDGKPNGDVVSGFTYVDAGTTADVKLPLNYPAKTGNAFIVMLHTDVDRDKVFDFVFVDDTHVEDKAVFEGTKMIAHIITVP